GSSQHLPAPSRYLPLLPPAIASPLVGLPKRWPAASVCPLGPAAPDCPVSQHLSPGSGRHSISFSTLLSLLSASSISPLLPGAFPHSCHIWLAYVDKPPPASRGILSHCICGYILHVARHR